MKRSHLLLPLGILLALLLAVPAGASVLETDEGIFYSVSDGVVTVEGFNAVGTVMDIPAQIHEMPVRHIANQACRGDRILTEVRIPESILTIGEFAFADCPNLIKVTLRGGESIGFSAFRGCGALLSLTLPDTLITIDDYAFDGCLMLGKVKIPASVTAIGVDAFMGCNRLVLNVKDNAYARHYAEQNHIPTGFTSTFAYILLLVALVSALMGGGVWLIGRRLRHNRIKRH